MTNVEFKRKRVGANDSRGVLWLGLYKDNEDHHNVT